MIKAIKNLFLIWAKTKKAGKQTKTYLGIEEKVPVKVGVIKAKSENTAQEILVFTKEIKIKNKNEVVIKNSKMAL